MNSPPFHLFARVRRCTMQIETVIQFASNIDDMDPRLWPEVIDRLLEAGAVDAWVTPIIMKKGRPAFTLGALCHVGDGDAVRTAIFRETTTIGVREQEIKRSVLSREQADVEVDGEPVRIKVASEGGDELNRSVEWDDVASAATKLGIAAKDVLAAANAAARQALAGGSD